MTEAAEKPIRRVPMTHEARAALQQVLAGNHPNAVVAIPAANLRAGLKLWIPTNGLHGAYINEHGEAV